MATRCAGRAEPLGLTTPVGQQRPDGLCGHDFGNVLYLPGVEKCKRAAGQRFADHGHFTNFKELHVVSRRRKREGRMGDGHEILAAAFSAGNGRRSLYIQ